MPAKPTGRVRHRVRDRRRLRARYSLTERRREDLDLLGLSEPGPRLPQAGPAPGAPGEAGPARAPDGFRLRDLLGCRRPVVVLRLEEDGDQVLARPYARPGSAGARAAVELLAATVQFVFRRARECNLLSEPEWGQLLRGDGASLLRRCLLLHKIAVAPSATVPLTGARGAGEEASYHPNNLGLQRFLSQFAALPDGTPFSLRALFRDGRGGGGGSNRKPDAPPPSGLLDLPEAVQLALLRRGLARESQARQALGDLPFGRALQQDANSEFGLELGRPSKEEMKQLRQNLDRHGLKALFPGVQERKRHHQQASRPEGP